jgi:cell division protein FtsN
VARLPNLLALLCGFAVAFAVGCGDRSNLIPASRAAELTQQLSDLQASIDAGRCEGLSGRVQAFRDDAADLGGQVDRRLRARINDGAASLQRHAVEDCEAKAAEAREQTETTPTETVPEETETTTTTTETQTQTATTETTPSTVTPPETTTPTTPAPEEPAPPVEPDPGDGGEPSDGNGGTSPEGGELAP